MTRIVLLLTAFPLAAVLALLLDTLLDRRLAAISAPARRRIGPPARRPRRALWLALALAPSLAAVPAVADAPGETRETACAAIECSLLVDAAAIDRLWKAPAIDGPALVAQSRIPVAFDTGLDRWDAEPGELADEGDDAPPVATAAVPPTGR